MHNKGSESMERIDKVIASQSRMSRKDVHRLIWAGRVCVNGKQVCKIDLKIDPGKVEITIDGAVLNYKERVYIMLNKPKGCVSASTDSTQKTVIDLVPAALQRDCLSPVGRLDKDTTGLLIITDDGEFSHRVTSPKKELYKKYVAMLDASPTEAELDILRNGVVIDGGEECRPCFARLTDPENHIVEISICEGKYHQVKRMAAAIGKKVLALKRISIGSLELDGTLSEGECRELTDDEVGLFTLK